MSNKLPRGLYALIDASIGGDDLVGLASAVVEGGAQVVQVRAKTLSDRACVELSRRIVAVCRARRVPCLINDRVDLALVTGADGVHLGADDLPVAEARRLLGVGAIIGATCRSLADIEQAQRAGADYAGVGPIFATTTKVVNAPVLGLAAFAEIVARSPLPVVGIAGITLSTIAAVAAAGANNAAVAGDLVRGGAPVSRARALNEAFCRGT